MKTKYLIKQNSIQSSRIKQTSGGRESGNPLLLLLTGHQWMVAFAVGAVLAMVCWPFYRHISPWVGGNLFLVGVTLAHLRYASRFIVPFPHIALLMAALQYVLAAWASAYWPADDPLYDIGSRLPQYLPFATLVLLACALGWGFGMNNLRLPARLPSVVATPRLLFALDALLVLGVLFVLPARFVSGTNYGFVFVLLASLRFVGVFGRMLLQWPGWGWRLALLALLELVFSTNQSSFHGIILFGFWTFALWAFIFRITWRGILAACLVALILLPALQSSKWQLRNQMAGGKVEGAMETQSVVHKTSLWSSYMLENLGKTLSGDMDRDFMGNTVARYNQGWIVDRVMQQVPTVEPYARGETLKDALVSSLVPRVFYPNKVMTGGMVNMERFAGIQLDEGTSMNLGYAGEMYANFGYWGGIIGCGFYCLGFALLFRFICIRAFVSPLWWAVLPYICFVSLKAEDDIVGVVNWTAKACVVLVGVCFVFPAFRRALFPAERSETRAQRPRRIDQRPRPDSASPEA